MQGIPAVSLKVTFSEGEWFYMRSELWRRVDVQVSLFTAVIVAILSYSIFMVQYRITYNDMLRSLNDQAEHIYSYIGERMDTDTFKHISGPGDVQKEDYQRMHDRFQRVKEITGVMYLYTAKMNDDGEFVYVVDCLDPVDADFRYPGDPIEREIYPDMQRALNGERVLPDKIKKTDWGKIFITYLPIYEGEEIIGVVGIEFRADHQYQVYQNLRRVLPVFILPFSLAASLVSRYLFRRISNPFYRDMSNMDYLTRLKNRNAYQLDMKNRIAAKKEKDTGFILIDLNSLKHINDTMGHETGDRYITCISQAYLNMGQEDGIMYRIGGDEFAVVIPGASEEKIRSFAGRLEAEFEKLAFMPGLTFAWGAAIYDADTDNDLFSTCRRADKNMYTKKQKFYEDRMKREDEDGIVGQAVKERAKGQ